MEGNTENIIRNYEDSSVKVLKLLNYNNEKRNMEKIRNKNLIEDNLENSLSEVYDIIMQSGEKIKNKIPAQFIVFLDKNRNKNYTVNINYNKNINDQKLLKNTRILLSLIYRDYLVDEKNRRMLLETEKEKIKDKYEIQWKRHKTTDEKNNKEQLMIIKKQTVLEKIIDTIKKLTSRDIH